MWGGRRLEKARRVTRTEIAKDLMKLGIKAGDLVFVHSSMRSIGYVQGGPDAVIDAIMDVLGSAGTLVTPAFSLPYGSMVDTLERDETFDPASTPSTVGLIPETFRRRQSVRRSLHPTSSVCAVGAKADLIILRESPFNSDFGVGTPLYKIMEHEGKILGLGADLGPVSFYHVIEDVLGKQFPVKVRLDKVYNARVNEEGKVSVMPIRPFDPAVASTRIDKPENTWIRTLFTEFLIDRGVLKVGCVGQARSWLLEAAELFEAQMELLKRGITIYTTKSEYDATGQRLISYVTAYRSAFSDAHHNYLEEQVSQVAKGHECKGFWNSNSNNWIRQLNWDGSDWSGFISHDWKYSMELQEGATQYALITGNGALDHHLKGELQYIHSRIRGDGSIIGIPDGYDFAPRECEYGAALSALALGYKCFAKRDPLLATEILQDLDLLHTFMSAEFKPTFDDPFSVVLRGYANLLSAYQILGSTSKAQEVVGRLKGYAEEFISRQAGSGLFPFKDSAYTLETSVHTQLKVDIGLLLSYQFTGSERYLLSAARNLRWVTENLLMPNGALRWDIDDRDDFFEIHQMLFLIAYRYLHDLSKGHYDYTSSAISAWKFLLDGNAGCIDMYVQNLRSTGAFFSFRHIDDEGNFQKKSTELFKGSYEIGHSLWGLSLNRDLAI
jgi:aminoglycoside 3-N-acetyltransferase